MNKYFSALLVFLSGVFLVQSQTFAQEYPDLFSTEEPLELQMTLSVKEVRKETNDSTFMDSFLLYKNNTGTWDTLDLEIRTRGNFRLKNCFYPPLRLKIKKKDRENTPFEGYKSLKLVTPCSKVKNANDYVAKEYLAYKLYEEVTDYTFKTRLLKISFVNQDTRKAETIEMIGFVIEDDDKVADRFEGEIYDDKKLGPNFMDSPASVRHDFFQFLIGNTDWSNMFMHNEKVLRLPGDKFVPLAYDFDMSGIVNPPYAQVSNLVDIEKITDRLYRGFCRGEPLLQAVREEFLAKETAILALIDSQLYLDEKDAKVTRKYLNEFFDILKTDRLYQSEIVDVCRSY